MLVNQIAAIRESVFLVLRIRQAVAPMVELRPEGTAFYIGNGYFLTADHLFDNPPLDQSDVIQVVSVSKTTQYAVSIDYRTPTHDLAILKLGTPNGALGALSLSVGIEPDGRSVFSYGFLSPRIDNNIPGRPTLVAAPRATSSIIGARVPFFGNRYELDGQTYPGESGAPVFRTSDHVVIGVVQATRSVDVQAPINKTRGPTIASPLDVIQAELTARGIAPVI